MATNQRSKNNYERVSNGLKESKIRSLIYLEFDTARAFILGVIILGVIGWRPEQLKSGYIRGLLMALGLYSLHFPWLRGKALFGSSWSVFHNRGFGVLERSNAYVTLM